MKFVGQLHIMNQLKLILPTLYENPSKGAGILLVGPSGWGKTTMAVSIAKYLVGKNFEFYLGESLNKVSELYFEKRVVFIDEIHKYNSPEILYPILDEKSHVIIMATNTNGSLPEALVNRCEELIFTEYDDIELLIIARESSSFYASDEAFMAVIEAGNRNPRVIKHLIDKLGMYFHRNQIDSRTADFGQILEEVFKIKDGLDTLCRRYIEVLSDVGGNASIILLKNLLHVGEDTLKNRVEPVLLRKGIIKITQKGRTLV